MREFFFLLLIFYGLYPVYSLDAQWDLEPVVIKNGVSNNTIYDVCYGSDGFIWLSTDKGISRYDGFRFRDYPLIMSVDSLSTPLYQAVKALREAPSGLFYALMYQGGITCFDKVNESFLPVQLDKPFDLKQISDFCWNDGVMYLATSQGLFESHTIRKTKGKEHFVSCILNPEPLVKGKIANLCADGKTNLYFSIDGEKVIHYDLVAKKSSLIKEYNVVSKLFLRRGYLWICGLWNDIICYDLKGQKERVVPMGNTGKAEFASSYITDLTFKDDQTLYLTTWDGLFKLSFDNGNLCESPFSLVLMTRNEKALRLNIENKMTSLFWDDKQQILWVGTFGGGVVKFDTSESMYSRVRQDFKSRVNDMVEDSKGYIWLVMTDGSVMRSTTPALSADTHFELWKKSASLSGSYHIYKGKNGNIWLGNNLGEIVTIEPVSENIESFQLQTNGGKKIRTVIHCFCLDSWNRLWVGTSDGLIQVDPKSHEGKKIKMTDGVKVVYSVAEDKEGNIWVGTDKGLKRIESTGDQILVEGSYEKENGLEEVSVRTIYVNNYNQIYAAYLNVVVRIDGRDKDKIESIYTLQHGLPDGHVGCMIDDHIGNTWAGNNVGVMTIRSGQEAFYNYLSVGNCSAGCRLNDGRLLWANSWGLLFFDPSVAKADNSKKQVILTDVEVNGEAVLAGQKVNGQVILSTSPEKQEKLVFSPQNNDFRLFFSDLRYGMTQRKIAYRLLPVDKDWKMMLLAESLWYNGLSAGKYTLQVKLVLPDGKEGDVIQIPIVVKSKWFHTVWAFIGYVLLLIVLSYILYYYLKRRELRKLLRHDRELILKESLNMEKIKQEQKQEIETMRNRLLMLFVQELRTPLSLIIAPLKDLQKDRMHIQNFSLQVAYRNALRMLDACDQLLVIYGQGSLVTKFEVALYQVEKLIDSNLLGIRELLKVYSIDFRCEKRIKKGIEFYVDKKKIEFIIHNLLTNAFTHTQYAGTVSLSVSETMDGEGIHYISLIVEDDGKMMVKTAEQLLGEVETLGNDLSAVQLGFAIMQQMVRAHHGTIVIESSEGKGTKVIMNLPTDKSVLEKDPNIIFIDPDELPEKGVETIKQPESDVMIGEVAKQENSVSAETSSVEEAASLSATGTKKTILIVEDHKDIRLYLKILLGKEYNLLMAINGQEGVDMAMKELPDLIICDVMMPVKDGFECCREVKEGIETCNIPFIILTAKVEDEDIIHGLELGADDYLQKPFTPGILKAKIRNLINGRQALKQMYTKLFMLPGVDAVVTNETEQVEEEVKMEDPFINSVIKIVEENICEADFSVKKLAAEMNMSQPTLYRKVKQSTDYTIIELIRGVRMRRAGVLLKTKNYGVQEVAEMVGYNDIPTFRKHFVDAFGTTPSTYE